jgi:Cdc6-like AAA superfamily ATPase
MAKRSIVCPVTKTPGAACSAACLSSAAQPCPGVGKHPQIVPSVNAQGKRFKPTIFCVQGHPDTGKTQTIIEFCRLLVSQSKRYTVSNARPGCRLRNDILVVIHDKTNDRNIGLCSHGDVPDRIREYLSILVSLPCEAIVCASRHSGQTVQAVRDIVKKNPCYQLIWTAPYAIDPPMQPINTQHTQLHACKARHLECLLAETGCI